MILMVWPTIFLLRKLINGRLITFKSFLSFTFLVALIAYYVANNIFIPKIEQIEGLRNMAEDFINSIQSNKEPLSNFDLGLDIVKILESAQKSIKNNGVKINL